MISGQNSTSTLLHVPINKPPIRLFTVVLIRSHTVLLCLCFKVALGDHLPYKEFPVMTWC